MRSILIVFVVAVFLSGIMAVASAVDPIELSTLNKTKTSIAGSAITLPQLSPSMPTIAPTTLGGNTKSNVMDLSTLGRKSESNVPATEIKSASPITITPMFAVRNTNISTGASTVFTLPQAVSSSASVVTLPIAIFGGA